MSRWPSPISAASSTWHAPSPDIWFPSPRSRAPRFAPPSTASSTPCSSLNMCSKCSVVPCPLALHALRLPASPIASSKSLPKLANSPQPKIGHRLAGYVGHPSINFFDRRHRVSLWDGSLPRTEASTLRQTNEKDAIDGCHFSLGLLVREDLPPAGTGRLGG